MDALTAGADIAMMVTALTVVTALYVWGRNQWHGWQQQKTTIARRTWHGYIAMESVDTWYVRLAEDPDSPSGRVVLEVLNGKNGDPDPMLAHGMRQVIIRDGMLRACPETQVGCSWCDWLCRARRRLMMMIIDQ